MQFGSNCCDLAAAFETFVPFTYDDARFPPVPARVSVAVLGTLTIGEGETGDNAWFGRTCTRDQARAWLTGRLTAAAAIVTRDAGQIALTQNQFDALTDFVFNCGAGNFESSTLLKDLLAGDLADVPAQLARWDHAQGKVSAGLDRRRAAEIALWSTPDDQPFDPNAEPSPSEALARSTGESLSPARSGSGAGSAAPGEGSSAPASDSSADQLNVAELAKLKPKPAKSAPDAAA